GIALDGIALAAVVAFSSSKGVFGTPDKPWDSISSSWQLFSIQLLKLIAIVLLLSYRCYPRSERSRVF
ncbi:hypothetical protein, partial [Thermosynechococcus sp.]|uniref:hypothetical protein n=1 Tax=Thermosynechococcus sp. TaxID=2814275 RepID=UPI0039195492